jgi:predicted nuclease with RNAse H fold
MELARRLSAEGLPVIEAYPGGAQDLLGIPRKGEGEERLRRALVRFGFSGSVDRRAITHDELDAVLCAYTGREHLAGRSLVLGDPAEGTLVLPRARERSRVPALSGPSKESRP